MTEMLRPMEKRDAGAVARLHAETITNGFLRKLGRRFLRQLYLGVAADPGSWVCVAERNGAVLGFLAYSQDVSAMYRRVLRARWWRLGLASLPRSLNLLLIKEILDTSLHPAKQAEALPRQCVWQSIPRPAAQGLAAAWWAPPCRQPATTQGRRGSRACRSTPPAVSKSG